MADSKFAPAPRADQVCLARQQGYFLPSTLTRQLLDALPGILCVLNDRRQLVYVNRALVELVGRADESSCLGLRPGEILGCSHAGEMPGGCGTSESCSTCGAVLAVLSGLSGRSDVRECRLTRCGGERFEALDLQVMATPLVHAGERFVVLAIADISNEKRRQSLERIFFHDILNVMGSVRGFAELLQSYELDNRVEICRLIHEASAQVIEEIEAQQMLLAAENGSLKPQAELVDGEDLLLRLAEIYRCHRAATGKELVLDRAGSVAPVLFASDRALLRRVLGNMIKNALEAVGEGDTVSLCCRQLDGQVEFAVHNPGEIPRSVGLQIFKRYFSTKGGGRGLGTYSMKLLSDYLRGEVAFTSSSEAGTVFRLRLPNNSTGGRGEEGEFARLRS